MKDWMSIGHLFTKLYIDYACITKLYSKRLLYRCNIRM